MANKKKTKAQQNPTAHLHAAHKQKNDEFYTQLNDISEELKHYREHFRGKVVLCNCDDPKKSAFFEFFSKNFKHELPSATNPLEGGLGLKRLITTCYKSENRNLFSQNKSEERSVGIDYEGDKSGNRKPHPETCRQIDLPADEGYNGYDPESREASMKAGKYPAGDFRSRACIELLQQADIVVTNPPFSLFREYVAQLVKYNKKFLIIGNDNAITYKEIFPLIKDNKLWRGWNKVKTFIKPDGSTQSHGNVGWFTNLPHNKRTEGLDLEHQPKYKGNEANYPKYDNYDAIEVGKVENIPGDYYGVMGVPISFLDKYNPEQFELIGCNRGVDQDPNGVYGRGSFLNGKEKFKRIFIRRR